MNNILSAIKNLPRHGQHNLAKIVCLGFGLAVSAVLIGEVYFEQTFETWFPGHERTYAVSEDIVQNGQYNEWSSTSGAVAQGIKAISPQVEAATRYSYLLSDMKTTVDGRPFSIDEVRAADSYLFDIFPRATVQGNLKEGLSRPYYCVISRSMADRIGGNVVGKAFEPRDWDCKLIIGGVYEDFPYNSRLHGIDVIVSMPTLNQFLGFDVSARWVGADRFSSFVRLRKGTTIDDLKPNVRKMIAQHSEFAEAEKAGIKFNYAFSQVTADYTSNPQVRTMCWIMSLLAVILLVSTVVNYLLIVMGNVVSRFREMAVRKCFGGGPLTIYGIMVSESLVHVVIGIVLAAVLVFACKGTIEGYISAPVSTMLFSRGSWILALICLFIVFIGGLVPGYIYNKVPVTAAFRGVHEARRRWKLIMLSAWRYSSSSSPSCCSPPARWSTAIQCYSLKTNNKKKEVMIKVQDLIKTFRTEEVETIALDKVSFEVKDGEFVAIMGPSGCGKSTLLNILGLLDNPTSGQYWLDGKEVSGLHENERTAIRKGQIGFVFQSFNLIDELNVEENIELPLTYLGISKAERKQKVQEVMARMNISHRAKHFPHQLSGGQQQRVAIARAVVFGPKLILADEPTGNLDSKNGAEVMQLLTELNQDGATIVMVTHNAHDAELAHRIVHLFDGHIVANP